MENELIKIPRVKAGDTEGLIKALGKLSSEKAQRLRDLAEKAKINNQKK